MMIRPLLLILAVMQGADSKNQSKKLDSPQPNECEPWMYQCPPHFSCLPRQRLDGNHCVCNRFLGFRGPECRKHSRASWLLLVLSITNAFMSFRALLSNIMLALELKNSGRLKANNIGRTLFFNTLVLLPAIAIATGYSLIILKLDTNADFEQQGIQVCVACLFFFYLLSTLSVSMVWIVDVQRMSSLGLGRESQLAKKRQERIWLLATYVVALSCVTLLMTPRAFLGRTYYIPIVLSVYNFIVAGSYHYAGRRVVRDLSLSEVDPTSARHVDIAQIAENIRVTSQTMTRLMLGMSVSFIGAALTVPTPAPLYRAQNSLPRILQAQFFLFASQQCALGVNNLIVKYIGFGSSKRHPEPELRSIVSALRWLFCCSRCSNSNSSNVSSASDLVSNSSGGSMVWSQLRFNLNNGRAPRSQHLVKVAMENVNNLIRPQFCSVLLSGAEPFLPMVLITLLHTKVNGDGDGMTPVDCYEQVMGQAVMDIGEDVVVNLDSDDMATNTLGVLSKGSHAFVQCYGEEHLRCTWHAFEFGFAGGHDLLAEICAVLMEGEIEVDAQGLVTRWLYRGGSDASPVWELDIPPRWVVKLAGLPFSTAWIPVSALDVNKLEASCQASLVSDGVLFRIDCGAQQRTLAHHTSLLDISGVSQTSSSASTIQANMASLKAAITNACDWEDSSMSSAASGTISDRSESMDLNYSGRAAKVVRGVQVCVVPRSCAHKEDMWIVNGSGLGLWKYSPMADACVSLLECLSCRLPKYFTNFRSKQVHPAGSQRTGNSGGSRGTRRYKWGLDDTTSNEGDAELNISGIENTSGNKHTEDGPMGSLGAIAEEERPEEIKS